MCILYNANTKQFISFDIVLHKMAATTDITAAREFTDDEADRLKQRCSSKLKNFQPYYRQQFDESGILLPDNAGSSTASDSSDAEPFVHILKRRAFTPKERLDIYIRDKGVCGICGQPVAKNNYTIDHIIPLSKGGSYKYTNLQCCCKRCNQFKADSLPSDFFDIVVSILNHQVNEKQNEKLKEELKKILLLSAPVSPVAFESPEINDDTAKTKKEIKKSSKKKSKKDSASGTKEKSKKKDKKKSSSKAKKKAKKKISAESSKKE